MRPGISPVLSPSTDGRYLLRRTLSHPGATHMGTMVRPLVAEFIGTFGLVFIGAGAVVVDASKGGALGLVGVALAHALVLSIMVTAMMNISGGQFNPAVSVGLWIAGKMDAARVV